MVRHPTILVSASVLLLTVAGAPHPVAAQGGESPSTGRTSWHDLVTRDLETSRKFLAEVFGWSFGETQSGKKLDYAVASLDGHPVAGLAQAKETGGNTSQWLTYVTVPDLDAAITAATAGGASVAIKPMKINDRGRGAVLLDPQGAPFGLLERGAPAPQGHAAPVKTWVWHELFTKDVDAAATFYEKLFGVRRRMVKVGEADHLLLQVDTLPVVGVLESPKPEIRPHWLPFVRVPDINAVIAKTTELGGRVILAPRPDLRNGTVAIIADPTGAAVGVQQL
jgi:predicted enzyme related to lactoylglutathione lyase